MKKTKMALLHSIIALVLCFSMFAGTTFAWFTDSVESGMNQIVAGNLDIELLAGGKKVDESTQLFRLDAPNLWEPGMVVYENLTVVNAGTLALKWQMALNFGHENDLNGHKLSDVLRVAIIDTVAADAKREDILAAAKASGTVGPLSALYKSGELAAAKSESFAVVIFWEPGDHDNDYNANNGKATSDGQPLHIEFGVRLQATQMTGEPDSFDDQYDAAATFPGFDGIALTADITGKVGADNKLTEAVALTDSASGTAVVVQAGTLLKPGATKLTLTVDKMESTSSNITLGEGEDMLSLDVHLSGVAGENTTPVLVTLPETAPTGLNIGNYKFYHVEAGGTKEMTPVAAPAAHNDFSYDPATGDVTLALATFSEVALVAETDSAWEGTFATAFNGGTGTESDPYIIANADQLAYLGNCISTDNDNYGSKSYKLINDINMGGSDVLDSNGKLLFYPIGYTSEGYKGAFKGEFDGNGHTISNIYQNTWMLVGTYDGTYYNAAMGLFGYVYGGTVKNLTVDSFSSDGEFTPTGVIAAYAAGDAAFENIAITNCNPRVYNTGNGGIIGVAGNTSAANDDHITLSNITVDNSNKISALWGSWDVACGGLVGMYRGNVDGSGNATGDTITFTNCHVSAQIDVYNDVCANYQYYAYRYAGMIIGSVRHNTKDENGKSIPNMTGISASGCTVNYGDWNDYYYCEFEKNTIASYSEDYQFSRVPHSELKFTDSNGNGVVDADERASVTGCNHTHTAEENHQAIYLPFHQLFTGYGWGVNSIGLEKYSGIVTNLDITEGDQEESVEKFETKFTGDFLYRVGNQNTVSLGSLFAAKDGVTVSSAGTWVTVEAIDDDMTVSGTFSANTTDWTAGAIQFSGTGVVKVTIQDYNFCKPTTLILEVVDAVNATTAQSTYVEDSDGNVTFANNVVLLNDAGFSSLEVSNGYALYGNGFTLTCSTDSYAKDFGYAFVTLENGTLDNVQIECPNFDYAALYKSNLTSSDNRSYTDSSGTVRYYNARSGVMVSGNSQILNSRISGARAAVNVTGGNCVIDNSRIELGAVASLLVGAANSVTLKDVTLVQKPTASTYDNSKTLMGFSVLMICNSNGDAAPIILEGTLIQNAWVDENDKQYVPSAGQSIIKDVLANTDFTHDLNNDGTKESLNLGFAYMPESTTSTVNASTITDNRTNKSSIPYDYATVSIANGNTYVYSYKYIENESIPTEFTDTSTYEPNKYSDIITVSYSDITDGLTTGKSYGGDGWIYELNVDLDTLSGYELDFSKLTMSVNGVTVADFKVNGSDKPTSPVAVIAGGTTYTLTATIGETEYIATLKVTGTETSKESPSLVTSNYETALLVGEAGDKSNKDTWHGAAPVLKGIQIKYWSVAEQQYKTITLSDYTPTTAGQQNGTNTTWTYSPDNGDFTLTITGGKVHSSNGVYAMPVVCNNTLYFVASSSSGLVNYGNSARTIPISYSFKDNNGGTELTFSNTWSIECADNNKAYDYSDFCSGTSSTFTINSENGCVTPDTLITLANGSQVRVDSLKGDEMLLVWNLETGMLDTAPIMFVDSETEAEFEIIKLCFSDGTDVKVIGEHGFWDYDLNKYVYLDRYAENYIGHSFAKQNGEELEAVELVDVIIETEVTTAWSPVTVGHLCYFVNGMLSMPGGVGGLFNIFEVDPETMTYDYEQLEKDIETYGLFTYEELNAICPLSEEMFNAAGGAYLKISIGKGNLTMDELIAMISRYSKFFD